MLFSPVGVNLSPQQLFEQFLDDDVIEYCCQQAILYASFKGIIPFSVDKDEMTDSTNKWLLNCSSKTAYGTFTLQTLTILPLVTC